MPGPTRLLRPALPKVNSAGVAYASGLYQRAGLGFARLGSPIRSGRSWPNVPVFDVSRLIAGENGKPGMEGRGERQGGKGQDRGLPPA